MEGLWQSQAGAALPVGESRPGWKVLRVLGNLLNLTGFEYQSSEDVRDELRKACGATAGVNGGAVSPMADIPVAAERYKGSHQVVRGTGGGASTNGGAAPARQGRASSTYRCTRSTRWCAGHPHCRRPAKAVRPRQRTDEKDEIECFKLFQTYGTRCLTTVGPPSGLS